MGKTYRPGQKVPVSGQAEIVGNRGGRTGEERTVVRGEPFPPTPKPGQGYVIVDRTPNQSGRPYLPSTATWSSAGARGDAAAASPFAVLELDLRSAFESEPLEDGLGHRAETLLGNALEASRENAAAWIRSLISESKNRDLAAPVLKCLGRLRSPVSEAWRRDLIRVALADADAEVRDAAVQAVENWGDIGLLPELETHAEGRPWLQRYIKDVIRDLRER